MEIRYLHTRPIGVNAEMEAQPQKTKGAVRTVLLVDDQPAFLGLARRLLEAEPTISIVGEARTGEQAVALLPALKPGVVILDVLLPGMNGFEAARRMREICPGLSLVMISAFNEPEFAAMAIAVGAAGFLAKRDLSARAVVHLLPS